MKRGRLFCWFLICLLLAGDVPRAWAVDYDIVYVRAPRDGDEDLVRLPEVDDPIDIPPGTDLVLRRADGTEEVLVAGGDGAVVDPFVSFDALWVYYAKFHDQRSSARDRQRPGAPSRAGSDLFKINLETREVVQLTFQEWTPNTGLLDWSQDHLRADGSGRYYLGYGVFNLGPCPLPGGKLVYTSSRNMYLPNKDFTAPNLQLFVMDNDGKNVELTGHLNLGSALHPTVLVDGRVMFSSYEGQGLRDRRLWGLWAIWPDGRRWEPLMSAFTAPNAFHFQTQMSNGDVAVVEYYNLNNNGFGTVLGFPATPPVGEPAFGAPRAGDASNPAVKRGLWNFQPGHPSHLQDRFKRYSFSPKGLYSVTRFAHGEDNAASLDADGDWMGKATHPSGAPGNDLLLVWSPGPANNLNRPVRTPRYDAGIYVVEGGTPVDHPSEMVEIVNDPAYNELQPRAVVTYRDVYGIDEPVELPWYRNDGSEHADLPAGTPFGIVGSSSFYNRDTTPGKGSSKFDGLEPFNTGQNGASTNWGSQGADAGLYSNSDIYAVRILSMEPTTHVSRGPGVGNSRIRGFFNHAQERLRILGEIPLRKPGPDGEEPLDPDGNPDTSFLARIPADTPFTFQTLDRDGLVLNMSQTWHQLRPGEVRHDCGGCHAHSKRATPFAGTTASEPGYEVLDVSLQTPMLSKDAGGEPVVAMDPGRAVDVEFHRDIKPVLERSCVGCHSMNGTAEAGLVLDDDSVVDGYDNTYNRLARDTGATYGIPPVIRNGTWRTGNASRYIKKFQSRRSLLIWKLFGRRLDGWTNADHPTESVPGDPNTLPEGASANDADIDYTGTIMPPPDSEYPPLSEDEKIMFARWVDLGAPITSQRDELYEKIGWFADELRPVLTVAEPMAGRRPAPLDVVRVGAFDYYSGLDVGSLSVTADFEVNGVAAGEELVGGFVEVDEFVWELAVDPPIEALERGTITVRVRDEVGNVNVVERTVSVGAVRSRPELSGMDLRGDGSVELRVRGEPGNRHVLEYSDDLQEWVPFKAMLDFDGEQGATDAAAPGSGGRYYRVVDGE